MGPSCCALLRFAYFYNREGSSQIEERFWVGHNSLLQNTQESKVQGNSLICLMVLEVYDYLMGAYGKRGFSFHSARGSKIGMMTLEGYSFL